MCIYICVRLILKFSSVFRGVVNYIPIYIQLYLQHLVFVRPLLLPAAIAVVNYIPIYIQQDSKLHILLYLETAIYGSVCTSTHHQERIQLYLQHLVFVTQLVLPFATAADSSNCVTNNKCCRYSCMRSWWWVEVPAETCIAVSRYNKLCNVASCWIYTGIFLRCTDSWTLKVNYILWV